jgi:chromatin remodeling complex protein RSC6
MARSVKPTPATPAPAPATSAPEKKTVKKAKTVEPVATSVAVDVPAVVSESTEVPAVKVDIVENAAVLKLAEFGAKLQQALTTVSLLKNEYKALEKVVSKELKAAQKASRKRKTSGNRQPSGFIKPTLISNELAEFLGKPLGSELARTEVSREINAYIRNNLLQDKTNGRKIIPDAKLGKLLKMNKDDELTFFNLQRYMKHHFVKTTPVVAL